MKLYIILVLTLIMSGCLDNGISVPSDVPIYRLYAAPDRIYIQSRVLYLTTYMWRDFQPISPPSGRPLVGLVYITATDADPLPTTLSVDMVWIIYGNEIWKSGFSDEERPSDEAQPNQLVGVFRDGPKWGPHVMVDVVVRVTDGNGKSYLLRAPNQWIGMTV